MNVTLNNIANLQSDSTYYLSDSGQIKKAGLIHRLKCFFNIGHSKQRVVNLINEIQKTLLESAGLFRNQSLNQQLSELNMTKAVKGELLKNIANQFKTTNSKQINEKTATTIANAYINKYVVDIQAKSNSSSRNTESLRSLLEKTVSRFVKNPPLMPDKHGNNVVDEDALKTKLQEHLYKESKFLFEISGSSALEKTKLTNSYISYLKDNAYDIQGNRIVDTITDLKTQYEADKAVLIKSIGPLYTPEKFDAGINYLLEQAKSNDDLHDILLASGIKLLADGSSKPRSLESLKKKIDGIKANLAEIKKLAHQNKTVSDFGFNALKGMEGKSLPDGFFTKLYKAAMDQNLDDLFKLNANSSELEIHKGLTGYRQMTAKIMSDSGANEILADEEEKIPCKQFISDVLVSRLTPEQKNNVKQALTSLNSVRLNAVYNEILDVGDAGLVGMPNSYKSLFTSIPVQCQSSSDALLQKICRQMGLDDPKKLPDYVGFDQFSKEESAIYNDMKLTVVNEIKERIDSYVDNKFKGDEFTDLRKTLKDKMFANSSEVEGSLLPRNMFVSVIQNDVKTMLNYSLLCDFKKSKANELKDTTFAQDNMRDFKVNLPGGKTLTTQDPEKARDEIAQFVTKNPQSKFADLDNKTKDKVLVLMSMLSQVSILSMNKAQWMALTPNRNNELIQSTGSKNELKEDFEMGLGYDDYGNITVSSSYKRNFSMVYVEGVHNDYQKCSPQSNISSKFEIAISDQTFEKISNMNLEVYPTDDIENVSANRGEYKNINNPNDVLAQKLGPDFSIDLRVKYASLNCEIKH